MMMAIKTSYGVTFKSQVLYVYAIVMFISFGLLSFGFGNEAWFYLQSTSPRCLGGRTFLFNGRKGFGTSKHCTSHLNPTFLCPGPNAQIFCKNFCFEWAYYGERIHYPYHGSIWRGIDKSTKLSHMYSETQFLWSFMYIFMLISCVLAFFSGCLMRSFASTISREKYRVTEYYEQYDNIRSNINQTLNTENPSFYKRCCYYTSRVNYSPQNTAVLLAFFSCILSSVALFSLMISSTLNPVMWEIFFYDMQNTGGNINTPLNMCDGHIVTGFTMYGWTIIGGSVLSAFTSYSLMWVGVHCNRQSNDGSNCGLGQTFHEQHMGSLESISQDGEDAEQVVVAVAATNVTTTFLSRLRYCGRNLLPSALKQEDPEAAPIRIVAAEDATHCETNASVLEMIDEYESEKSLEMDFADSTFNGIFQTYYTDTAATDIN